MQKETIVISGISGRVGQKLYRLLHEKYQIIGMDVSPIPFNASKIDFIYVDLSNHLSIKEAFATLREKTDTISSFIHLAAYYNFKGGKKELYEKITIQGTQRILENLKQIECEQFVFSSTMLVHAPVNLGEKISETSPLHASWEYPYSKIETEKLIKEEANCPFVILRIAGCYDEWCHSIPIAQQIQRTYEKHLTRFFFPGNYHHGSAFLSYEDLGQAVEKVVEKRKELQKNATFLLGEEKTYSYKEIQMLIEKALFGKKKPIIAMPKKMIKLAVYIQKILGIGDPFIQPWMIDIADYHYCLDITQAKQSLGWAPKDSIADILILMIQHLQDSPDIWYRENQLKKREND